MDLDPIVAPPDQDKGAISAIENEIPAYRAISPMAVFSLVLGVLSALSFADYWFLGAAVAAIGTGWLADRKIRRLPDVLTGRGLAQAGIGLGLMFGLSSVTIGAVQYALLVRDAERFARSYAQVLRSGDLAQALHYKLAPQARRQQKPEETLKQFQQAARDPAMFETEVAGLRGLFARGFDLRLMSSVNDASGLPSEGKNLIIVADVDHVLHIRVFDGDGKMIVDTDETRLPQQARPLEDLRSLLESLWPPHELTRSEKDRIIIALTPIVGPSLAQGTNRGGAIRFLRLEKAGTNRLEPYAAALYEVIAAGDEDKSQHDFALVELKGTPQGGRGAWYVGEIIFPYTLNTYQVKEKPIDDGHGHGGHGHAH
ncbi:MAG: DUF4190 domain-containing protein [Isosphaeraceae bacterium]|nr:DUF4190 domain-containing protein [Isosphaeraceae bacterium]